MNVRTLLFALLTICVVQSCIGAKIVVTYVVASKSHIFGALPLIEELAKRGHEVTVFTPYEGISKNVLNVREVILSKSAKEVENTPVNWFAMSGARAMQLLTMLSFIKDFSLKGGEELITHPDFQEIVKNREVDLFIVDALFHEFLFPVFNQIGVPFVTHSSSSAFPSTLAAMGAPIDYASVPNAAEDFDSKMTFFQRLMNFLPGELFNLYRVHYILNDLDKMVQNHFPGARPTTEVEGEVSLCLINAHPVTNWPRSLPPTIIPVGALHTRPAKPLPEKFKEFADGSKEGLVVFTLGSAVPVSTMPKKTVETFIRVFSKLPQRVIWKWEGETPANIPSNILMSDWLPQQDLLGHPNTKVFITHGGMLGTQEAAYHGVPLLGIPFGNDQRGNIAKAKRGGWATQLEWDNINDQNLFEALTFLIRESSVRANASHVSRLMKDEVVPGKDLAVYWVEYVLRHGGTKHLHVEAKNLPYYKQNLIDVALFLLIIFLAVLFCLYVIICSVIRFCTKVKGGKVKTK